MSRSKNLVRIEVEIPESLLKQAEKALEEKGSNLADLIRTSLRRYVRMPDVFGLDTPMSFGQYKDELMETLIRVEPRYIVWCLLNIHGFQLDVEARELLDSLMPDDGLVVRCYEKGGSFEDIRVLPSRSREDEG